MAGDSLNSLAKEFKVTAATIWYYRKRLGVQGRDIKTSSQKISEKRNEYVLSLIKSGLTNSEIKNKTGCYITLIRNIRRFQGGEYYKPDRITGVDIDELAAIYGIEWVRATKKMVRHFCNLQLQRQRDILNPWYPWAESKVGLMKMRSYIRQGAKRANRQVSNELWTWEIAADNILARYRTRAVQRRLHAWGRWATMKRTGANTRRRGKTGREKNGFQEIDGSRRS